MLERNPRDWIGGTKRVEKDLGQLTFSSPDCLLPFLGHQCVPWKFQCFHDLGVFIDWPYFTIHITAANNIYLTRFCQSAV